MKKEIREYRSFEEEFAQSAVQDYQIPADYKWLRRDPLSRFLSAITYGLAIIFGGAYCKLILHVKLRGKEKLKGIRGGFFLYGNHTQPIGDVFLPALCLFPRRIYTVVSPANYGIPVIGRLLPYLGALPIAPTLKGMKELSRAMACRLEEGSPVVIYPEARVWEYYTGIRPFPETSFRFPAKFEKPVFVMTVRYKPVPYFRRPVAEVFLDGPIFPEGTGLRERTEFLHRRVQDLMTERSRGSACNHMEYRKKEEKAE